MKDNRKAEVINEITELATRYAGTQQLRIHMSRTIKAHLKEQDRDTRQACAEAIAFIEDHEEHDVVIGNAIRAVMKAKAI